MKPRISSSCKRKPTRPPVRGPRYEEKINRQDLSAIRCFPGLPIGDFWDDLITSIRQNQVVIVTGETGSGKTTQLPKICMAAGRGRKRSIACTQPRRVAAITAASRVAEELGPSLSALVGYRVRFKDATTRHTRIKFMTDGMLLAELHQDRYLRNYDTIIVDEAHERSLNIDFILGILRRLVAYRQDLRIIITSATMDTSSFIKAFGPVPIVHVEGRSYPVEIVYLPPEKMDGDDEEMELPAMVTNAVRWVRKRDRDGDILIFLPTERDIQEAVGLLTARYPSGVTVLPMYGRLTGQAQRRIFRPSANQKIVVATNIAETSITVPGIRYVIDSGLARISRYNVRSRTRSLPVSPVSKASAMQRAGRAGRLEPGTCIRLYSKDDYEVRPDFTQPEILRSNLAEVVLRLLAMDMGPVEDFPFIDSPSPRLIKEGVATLLELGAIDSSSRLTDRGRIMARLPLDPRISRIILQALEEGCFNEAAIIGAALSIQDPRQRPAGKETSADTIHNRFCEGSSDFLTFLRIWEAFRFERQRSSSKNRLRKFCRENYLSFNRMREWEDIHGQIINTLVETGLIPSADRPTSLTPVRKLDQDLSDSIHRAVLSGFLSNLCMKKERGRYVGTKGKDLHIFPGSVLYNRGPRWIVAAEIVRTSRTFARIVAPVEPTWAEKLGGKLCRYHYYDPHWERSRGEAMVRQRCTLFGLPIVEDRKVSLKRVDIDEARRLLVSQGLVAGQLKGRFKFIQINKGLIREIQGIEDRIRKRGILVDDSVLEAFYDKAVRDLEQAWGKIIADERSLARAIRSVGADHLLRLRKKDLMKSACSRHELSLFPGHLKVGGYDLSLSYRFQPGDPADGVTVTIPVEILPTLPSWPFEWLVPGMLEEKLEFILKALPKAIRRRLIPVPDTARELARSLEAGRRCGLNSTLREVLSTRTGLDIAINQMPDDSDLPAHLKMRFEIKDGAGRLLASGRDLRLLKKRFSAMVSAGVADTPEWKALRKKWEKDHVRPKDLKNLPREIHFPPRVGISEDADSPIRLDRHQQNLRVVHFRRNKGSKKARGVVDNDTTVKAFTGLVLKNGQVHIRLFHSKNEALRASQAGARALTAHALEQELRYIRTRLIARRFPREVEFLLPHIKGGVKGLEANTYRFVYKGLLGSWDHVPDEAELVERIRELRPCLVTKAHSMVEAIEISVDSAIRTVKELYALLDGSPPLKVIKRLKGELMSEVSMLMPPDFPAGQSLLYIENIPRYLKGIKVRAQRAVANPEKDRLKAKRARYLLRLLEDVRRYAEALPPPSGAYKALDSIAYQLEDIAITINELKLWTFAPEIGTLYPISPKRLEAALNEAKKQVGNL